MASRITWDNTLNTTENLLKVTSGLTTGQVS